MTLPGPPSSDPGPGPGPDPGSDPSPDPGPVPGPDPGSDPSPDLGPVPGPVPGSVPGSVPGPVPGPVPAGSGPGPAGSGPGPCEGPVAFGDQAAPDGDRAALDRAAPDGDAHLLGPAEIRALAGTLDLHPTKTLGQNFVIDPNTVRRIVRASGVGPADVVLEVGPGLGSLTLALLDRVRAVMAVEVDPTLAGQLPATVAERAPSASTKLTVVAADALRITDLPVAPTALVANLPYNISVPVLLHLLAAFPTIERALVMVQIEVAQRLAADPGSRVYGVPSVKARWFGDVRQAGHVGRNVFWPVPNVDSGLVEVIRTAPPSADVARADVFAAVDAAFGQRRKMLRSALAGWAGGADRARAVLDAAGVDPTARGEVLDVSQFAALAAARRELAADDGS